MAEIKPRVKCDGLAEVSMLLVCSCYRLTRITTDAIDQFNLNTDFNT